MMMVSSKFILPMVSRVCRDIHGNSEYMVWLLLILVQRRQEQAWLYWICSKAPVMAAAGKFWSHGKSLRRGGWDGGPGRAGGRAEARQWHAKMLRERAHACLPVAE